MRKLILIICLFTQSFIASSQTWEAGISAGTSGYMGDISPVDPLNFTDLAFGGLVKRNFNGYWSAKLSFIHGKIRGNDADSSDPAKIERNLSFHSDLSELSLQVEFNLFKYLPRVLPGFKAKRFTPYIFTGISGVTFNPMADDNNGTAYELQPLQTEGIDNKYKKHALSVPYGTGVKYNIKGNLTLIGDIGYRTAFTDYLDDVSGTYLDINDGGQVADPNTPKFSDRSKSGVKKKAGSQRGDFRKRDTYMFAMISLTYTFVPVKCPTF